MKHDVIAYYAYARGNLGSPIVNSGSPIVNRNGVIGIHMGGTTQN